MEWVLTLLVLTVSYFSYTLYKKILLLTNHLYELTINNNTIEGRLSKLQSEYEANLKALDIRLDNFIIKLKDSNTEERYKFVEELSKFKVHINKKVELQTSDFIQLREGYTQLLTQYRTDLTKLESKLTESNVKLHNLHNNTVDRFKKVSERIDDISKRY